jgi:hypothetical protein
MATKRKIRKYKRVSKNPKKKKMPIRSESLKHKGFSKYYITEGLKFRSPFIQNYSNLIRQSPHIAGLEEVFDETLEGFLFRGPFTRDALSFRRYGVFMRVNRRIPNSTILKIKEALAGSKATLDVIEEQVADALLIRFGNNNKRIDADSVVNGLNKNQDLIESIYDLLTDYGDVFWGLEFETEEEIYDK